MTCLEWREGYKQGFEDGYEKARRDLTDTKPVNPLFNTDPYCKVCGISMKGVMGYVCFHDKCPTKVTCGSPNISYTMGRTVNLGGQHSVVDKKIY